MIVFQVSLNFDPAKKYWKTMSDFYFNKENDYSEENTSDDEDFGSPILHIFQSDPGQKKRVVMRTMRKKIVKQSVIRRYSSK